MLTCPQCRRTADSGRLRLVQDSCGHQKCRECLLSEESGCFSCSTLAAEAAAASANGAATAGPIPAPAAAEAPVYTQLQTRHANQQDVPLQPDDTRDIQQTSTIVPCENMSDNAVPISSNPPAEPRLNCGLNQSDIDNENEEGGDDNAVEKSEGTVESKKGKRQPSFGLKKHIVVTPGEPPMYHCRICNKSFKNRKAARYHNYCGLPDSEKPHKCDICGQGFVTSGHHAYHMKSHTGALPFSCELCGKGFKQASKLKRHCKSHKGDRPFKCDVCNNSFSAKHVLKDHMLTHSGDRPFSCSTCFKKFNSKSCLRKHKLLHCDPTHKCNDCGKKFPLKWNLDTHRKTHMRERNHKCSLCNRAFKIAGDLKRHAVVHKDEGEWDCKVCGVVMRRKDNLVRHLKNIHPESLIPQEDGKLKDNLDAPSKTVESAIPAPQAHAVSVIRSRPVPVIQEPISCPESGVKSPEAPEYSQDPTDIHRANSFVTSNSLQGITENYTQNNYFAFNSAESSVLVPSAHAHSGHGQPLVVRDQGVQRTSVLQHSDSRVIVHYGSSAYGSVPVPDLDDLTHMRTRPVVEVAGESSYIEGKFADSQEKVENTVWRPRVIVQKNQSL